MRGYGITIAQYGMWGVYGITIANYDGGLDGVCISIYGVLRDNGILIDDDLILREVGRRGVLRMHVMIV